nr:hypothetical protein [Gemmatimonadota bacterium]
EIGSDLRIVRVAIQRARIPAARFLGIPSLPCNVAEMPEHDDILGIERERLVKYDARFLHPASVIKSLTVNNVTAHVTRLLSKVSATNRYCLLGISCFAVLVGKRRKIPTRILVEFLP